MYLCTNTRPITSYAMFPVDHKLWSTVPPVPLIYLSLSRREKKIFFFGQKVSSLSHLSSLSRSLVVISHLDRLPR